MITNAIHSLSGDGTTSGSGTSAVFTLARVNNSVGTWNNVTVNSKGLITSARNISYLISSSIIKNGDLAGSSFDNPVISTINGISASFFDVTSSIQSQINSIQAGSFSLDGQGFVFVNGTEITYKNDIYAPNTLTGYVSGAGTISSTDTVLQAIQKLNGNIQNIILTGGLTYSNFIVQEIPSGVIDGENASFTIEYLPVLNSEMLFLNGLLQIRNSDYTLTDSLITFSVSPSEGDNISITYQK